MGGRSNNDNQTRLIPQQLKKARLARGLTINELAQKIDVTRQAVSQYELGQSYPKGETFQKILEALQFPRGFFMKEQRDLTPKGPAFFRSLQAATKKSRDMQIIRADFVEEVRDYISNFIDLPELNIVEPLSKELHEITSEDIQQLASELRQLWGLGDRPIPNIIKLLEKNGIAVASLNFSDEKLDAFSQWRGSTPYIILSNEKSATSRVRFNCAHELGHILLHNSIDDIEALDSKEFKNLLEAQAHYFASCFLLPEDAFIDSIMSISLDYFIDLKKHWKASIQAMVRRCKDLEIINDNQYLYLNKKISQNKWRKQEPGEEDLGIEEPVIFNKAMSMILDHDVKSLAEVVSDLDIPPAEIATICRIPEEKFQEEIEVPRLRLILNEKR